MIAAKTNYLRITMTQAAVLVAGTMMLSACQAPQLPKLSLTRDVPAPVEIGANRVQRESIPVNRQITVRSGDTIYTLATRYQVTPQSLIQDNNLVSPFTLNAGQILAITPRREHIVGPTDSLFIISQRYAVSQFHIAELNDLTAPYELVVGQALLVPDTHDFSVLDGSEGVKTTLVRPAPAPTTSVAVAQSNQIAAPAKSQAPRKNFVAPSFDAQDGFSWPIKGEIISDFGPAGKGVHNDGVNIKAPFGTDVATSAPGTVAYIGENLKSFGTLVLVKHDGGYITAYAHLDNIAVAEGDVLPAGAVVGQVGQTGRVSSPQLHFEVRLSRQPVNPHDIISS
ncbi:MAG: peptidoglycan DD-metalloendopeptidase family protein [Candidatus Puniceispirillaceae bacterium]